MRPIVTDGVAWSVCRSVTIVNPAKTAKPIELQFGMLSLVGQNHVLDGVHIGATWRIRLNLPYAATMRPYVKLL